MSFLIPTNSVQIARFANGLYGVQLGFASTNGINSDVATGGLLATFNNYYSLSFGAMTTAAVASQIVTNLGIVAGTNGQTASSVSVALAYVTGQLNAAAPAARGAAVKAVLDLWSSISADPVNGATYGAAATTWNSTISGAVQYAGAVNPDITVAAAVAVNAANALIGKTFTLGTGVDNFVGTSANDTFTAASGNFTALDNLDGAGGSDNLNIAQTATAFTQPSGINIRGIANVNASFAAGGTINTTTGFAGVTSLNVNSGAGVLGITSAATTAVVGTNTLPGGNATTVDGGSSVNVSQTGSNATTNTITVGGTTVPVGAVIASSGNQLTVTTAAGAAATSTGSTITVTGGTTIGITQTNAADSATIGNVATVTVANQTYGVIGGAISVTGAAVGTVNTTGTTSVSVIQNAIATARVAVVISPADGTTNAITGTLGVVGGAVTIRDANAASSTVAGTITTVSLGGYGASTITNNALTTLNLSNGGGTLGLTNNLAAGFPTALTVNVAGAGASYALITDNSNKIATLNVNLNLTASTTSTPTSGTLSGGFTDTALRTLNVVGGTVQNVLTVSTNTTSISTSLTSLSVTGAAGINMDLSQETGLSTIALANSGRNTVIINAASQTYTGSTGTDIVTISVNPAVVITGNGGTDTIVLNGVGSSFSKASTQANLVGFSVLGTGANATGTFNFSNLPTSLTSINMIGVSTSAITFSNVAPGTPLTESSGIQSSNTVGGQLIGGVAYLTSDFNGATNALTLTLNGQTNSSANGSTVKGATNFALLELNDSIGGGLGTLNVVTTASVDGARSFITTLRDGSLTALNISGPAALTITTLTGGTLAAATAMTSTSLAITDNNTSLATVTSVITTLNDSALSGITYSGSKAFAITNITSDTATGLSITNSNTGASGVLTVGTTAGTSLPGGGNAGNGSAGFATLRLNGSVIFAATNPSIRNMTVAGSTDNQAVTIDHTAATTAGLQGTATGDTITLGNGANVISTGAGADTITLGSGRNTVTAGTGADSVTLAAHGAAALINLGTALTATISDVVGIDSTFYGASITTAAVAAGNAANANTTPVAYTTNSASTTNWDVYTGLRAGDTIRLTTGYSVQSIALTNAAADGRLAVDGNTVVNNVTTYTGANLTTTGLADNRIEFVRGVYNALTQTFNGSTTGTDSVMIYDANATAGAIVPEAIVLIGYVPGSVLGIASTAALTPGLITLG